MFVAVAFPAPFSSGRVVTFHGAGVVRLPRFASIHGSGVCISPVRDFVLFCLVLLQHPFGLLFLFLCSCSCSCFCFFVFLSLSSPLFPFLPLVVASRFRVTCSRLLRRLYRLFRVLFTASLLILFLVCSIVANNRSLRTSIGIFFCVQCPLPVQGKP